MATDTVPIAERGVATLSEQAWERARCRAEIIGPLAQSETVGHEAADAAAQALGLSRRQVYVLIRRARQGSGLVTDLALGQSSGGKGKGDCTNDATNTMPAKPGGCSAATRTASGPEKDSPTSKNWPHVGSCAKMKGTKSS